MRRASLPLLGISLTLFLLPLSAVAQELGVSYAYARSDNAEFPQAHGLTVHLLMEYSADWWVRASLHRISSETVKDGQVCSALGIGCGIEETHTSVSLTGFRLGILRPLRSGNRVRLGAGGGLSFNVLRGEGLGVSGRRTTLLLPKGGQVGAFGTVLLALTPSPEIPVTVRGGFNAHWVKFGTCSGYDPPQYDPFCTPGLFKEFDLGLSYSF